MCVCVCVCVCIFMFVFVWVCLCQCITVDRCMQELIFKEYLGSWIVVIQNVDYNHLKFQKFTINS